MEDFHSKRKQDGRTCGLYGRTELKKFRSELVGIVDVLLVNLPHEASIIYHIFSLCYQMTNRWFAVGRFRKNKPISNINCVQLSK